MGLAVICTLWHPDVDPQSESNERWIDIVILFSTCTSIILLAIALFKLVCGRGDLWSSREDEYEEIEDVAGVTPQLTFISPRLRHISAFDSPSPGQKPKMWDEEAGAVLHMGETAVSPGLIPVYSSLVPVSATSELHAIERPVIQTPATQAPLPHTQRAVSFVAAHGGLSMRPVEVEPPPSET